MKVDWEGNRPEPVISAFPNARFALSNPSPILIRNTLGLETMGLNDVLQAACSASPDALALTDAGEELTFGALSRMAQALAEDLSAMGLKRDDPVLLAVSSQARDIAGFLGIWQAGGVAVPIHRLSLEADVHEIAERVGSRFAVTMRPDLIAPRPFTDRMITDLGRVPPVRPLLHGAATICFTSGTTGQPKGVVLGHDPYCRKLDQLQALLNFQAGDAALMPLNLTFIFGQWVTFLTLAQGGTVHLVDRFTPDGFLKAASEKGITHTGMVPTMLRMLMPVLESTGAQFNGTVMLGGEVAPPPLAERIAALWPQARFWDLFGLSETGSCDLILPPEDFVAMAHTVGRPGDGIAVKTSAENGELLIKTPCRMLGYLDAPETTAEAFTEDGYFRTGDLATIHEDGTVELIGRAKELINRAGNKISPLEVERALMTHPDISAALATGLPHDLLGESLQVMLVPKPDTSLDVEEVKAFIRIMLPGPKRPDGYLVRDSLPTGRTGKADRGVFKKLLLAMEEEPAEYASPACSAHEVDPTYTDPVSPKT